MNTKLLVDLCENGEYGSNETSTVRMQIEVVFVETLKSILIIYFNHFLFGSIW